jgi:hypothetical protein
MATIFSSKQTADNLPAAPEGDGEAVELWIDPLAELPPDVVDVAFPRWGPPSFRWDSRNHWVFRGTDVNALPDRSRDRENLGANILVGLGCSCSAPLLAVACRGARPGYRRRPLGASCSPAWRERSCPAPPGSDLSLEGNAPIPRAMEQPVTGKLIFILLET